MNLWRRLQIWYLVHVEGYSRAAALDWIDRESVEDECPGPDLDALDKQFLAGGAVQDRVVEGLTRDMERE